MIFAPVFVVYFWLLNIGSTIAGVNLEPIVTEERLEESKMEFSVISPLLVLVVGLYTSQVPLLLRHYLKFLDFRRSA